MKKQILPLAVLLLAAALRLLNLASVPYGWHPDEATKALLARDLLAGGQRPVFFSAYTGREALYVYLESGLSVLIGEGIFTGRLLSAFSGLLTIALTFALGRLLFSRRTALMTAALMAVSMWHLIASRNGYRAVIQPMVQLLALWFLLRGLMPVRNNARSLGSEDRPRTTLFLAAGFFIGLGQYTYTAVRLFPILLVLVIGLALLLDRRHIWRLRALLALSVLAALIIFLPLGWHFYQNPIDFYGRAAQISVFSSFYSGGDPLGRLWQSILETARMWTIWGDTNYRFNIPGVPVFTIVEGWLFYGGALLALWLAGTVRGMQRLPYLLPWLWTLTMLLPMALSAESLPYYQRAIGVLPAIFFFPALLLERGIALGSQRLAPRLRRYNGLPIVLLFAYLAWRTGDAYFRTWHQSPQNDDHRRVAMVYVADYLNQLPASTVEWLYVSSEYIQHPTLALLSPQLYDWVRWFNATQTFPLPPDGVSAHYILPLENQPQQLLLSKAIGLTHLTRYNDRFGRPVFDVYLWQHGSPKGPFDLRQPIWSPETTFPPDDAGNLRQPVSLPVSFDHVLSFHGSDRSHQQLAPGQRLEMVLHWSIHQRPVRDYTFFVHLLNEAGQVVAGYDRNTFPTMFWATGGGESLLSYFPLDAPPDLEPGVYQVEIGVYHQPSGERLPVVVDGASVADRLLLAPLEVR
jgi:4-amino-4-deoxy-L-arabinose transferase-like glycosyltransferase